MYTVSIVHNYCEYTINNTIKCTWSRTCTCSGSCSCTGCKVGCTWECICSHTLYMLMSVHEHEQGKCHVFFKCLHTYVNMYMIMSHALYMFIHAYIDVHENVTYRTLYMFMFIFTFMSCLCSCRYKCTCRC